MTLLICLCIPVILAMAAFAIQISYHELARVELRTAIDAATEAAASTLSETGSVSQAKQSAIDTAALNKVSGESCVLVDSDIEVGHLVRADAASRYTFVPGLTQPTALRITSFQQRPYAFSFLGDTLGVEARAIAGQTDRDIVIVLDRSGSMVYTNDDGTPTGWAEGSPAPSDSRWSKVVDAANLFLDEVSSSSAADHIGLVTYNDSATIDVPIGTDSAPIRDAIDWHTANYADGGTSITGGIESALLALDSGRPLAAKIVVLMTDGIQASGIATPEDAAAIAADAGVIIHTVTYGADADTVTMETVAQTAGGSHWHAPDSDELVQAFGAIANKVPTLLVE